MRFDGETFDDDADGVRLTLQFRRVRALMSDGAWRTLAEIAQRVDAPEASVSARLRDLRKPRFGSFVVERRRVAGAKGLWEYRVLRSPPVVATVGPPTWPERT